MSSVNDDAAGVTQRWSKQWGVSEKWSSGDAYEPYVGRWSRRVAPEFLEWAKIPAGRVLDVGCGTGALSQALLDRDVRGVVGIDPSAAFASYAAARIKKRASRASFIVGDAMALPYGAETFDAAIAGLVLNFVPHPLGAVREMSRITRKHGVVAAYVWDYAGRMELMRHFWDAAVALDPQRAGTLDEGVRFPISHPDRLTTLFSDGSLEKVQTTAIDVPTVFRDFDDYWQPFLGGQAPAPGYAMSLSPERREQLRELIRSRLPVRADGRIHLIARAWAVKGMKP